MTGPADTINATLALYADGPAQLEAALTGLTESDLNLAQTSDSWTIRQIVHHLADGDDLWKICIKAALGNSEGLFSLQWYWDKPQTEWAENWKYADRSIEPSLALLRANRHHIVELVQQTPNAWEKSIRLKWPDSEEERITIRDVLEMQANHIVGHINDIRMIRQAHITKT
jgi:DinB superfamily